MSILVPLPPPESVSPTRAFERHHQGHSRVHVSRRPPTRRRTSRAFEYEQFSPPPNVRVVGPRLDDPVWAGGWSPPAGDDPLVLVGMSSTFMDHADALQRATSALSELPVRGLVTTGPSIPADAIDAPANVTVVERAPHTEVLKHAAAVVTHAGHGTVIKSLAAGVPVVAIPLGRDQLDNAARVAHHGAGIRLKPKASAKAIERAVRRVVDESSFRANAERLAAAIAVETAEDRATAELEELAGAKNGVRGSDPLTAGNAG